MSQDEPRTLKPFPFPWWLKIGAVIGFGGYICFILFVLFSSLLPTFGELKIEKNGRVQTYKYYDLSCVYGSGSVSISFLDKEQNLERKIDIGGGQVVGIDRSSRLERNSGVTVDGSFLDKKDCLTYGAMTARHRFGRSGGSVYEYALSLDCTKDGERIMADLRSYGCSKKYD